MSDLVGSQIVGFLTHRLIWKLFTDAYFKKCEVLFIWTIYKSAFVESDVDANFSKFLLKTKRKIYLKVICIHV